MTHARSLPVPEPVVGSPEDGTVLEVARVWINQGRPSIVVSPAFDDPRVMGMMLAELCWNFAYAYAQKDGIPEAQARELLKEGWLEGHRNGEANLAQREGGNP